MRKITLSIVLIGLFAAAGAQIKDLNIGAMVQPVPEEYISGCRIFYMGRLCCGRKRR